MIKLDHKFYSLPGVLLSVSTGAHKLTHYCAGLSNIVEQQEMTAAGLFRCGLVTRLFTMVIAMRLVEEGAFALDSPLEWVATNHQQDRGLLKILCEQYPILKPVTLRELLNNTSGLPAFEKTIAFSEIFAQKPHKVWQVENYLDAISGIDVRYQYGYTPKLRGYFNDSGTNYILVGLMIDAVSGVKTSDAMRDLFHELELYNTHYLPYGEMSEELVAKMTHGYLPISHPFASAFSQQPRVVYNNNKELSVIDVTNAYTITGMGNAATISSSSDLIKGFKKLINAEVIRTQYKQILKEVPIRLANTSKDYFCLGFYKSVFKRYGEILWTAGNSLGYGVLLAHAVERDLTFVLMTNVSREHFGIHSEGLISSVLAQVLD